jgi:hypothetical protein
MKRKSLLAIVLLVSILLLTGHVPASQKNRMASKNYRITQISPDGLRAFVKFTGAQIIIINNDDFDWTNVHFAVRAVPVFEPASSESPLTSPIAHTWPRIRARGVHTISAFQPVESTSPEGKTPIMRPVSLEIWCDTPQGRNFWAGRWE